MVEDLTRVKHVELRRLPGEHRTPPRGYGEPCRSPAETHRSVEVHSARRVQRGDDADTRRRGHEMWRRDTTALRKRTDGQPGASV